MDKRIFWYSVISSIVASIAFSWLLEPGTRWLWNFASESASSTLIRIQNAAFQNAALGKRDWVTVAIFLQAGLYVWSAILGALIAFLMASRLQEGVWDLVQELREVRWMRNTVAGGVVVVFLLGTYHWMQTSFFMFVDLQLNASFSQRLDALGPYIDGAEEKRLRSSWALMKTHDDYDRINRRMEELAVAAQMTLPELLYK